MRALLLLVVFLAACSGPTQYAQGVPMAPRSPAFNPMTDSPITIGQPGYGPASRVVPQPNPKPTRLLPPTREPGLWGSTAPSAAHGPVVLGVELPMPPLPPGDGGLAFSVPAITCAQSINRRIDMLGLAAQAMALPMPQRTCFLARLYDVCLQRETERVAKSGSGAAILPQSLALTASLASAFHFSACGDALTPDVVGLAGLIEKRWGIIDTHGGTKK